MYTNIRIRGMDGRGWGLGIGCKWLAGLVSRVYIAGLVYQHITPWLDWLSRFLTCSYEFREKKAPEQLVAPVRKIATALVSSTVSLKNRKWGILNLAPWWCITHCRTMGACLMSSNCGV